MYRSTRKRDKMGYNKFRGIGHIHILNEMISDKYLEIINNIVTNAIK